MQKIKSSSGFIFNVLGVVGSIASIFSLFSASSVLRIIGIVFVINYIIAVTIFVIKRYFSLSKIKRNIHLSYVNKLTQLSEKNRHIFNYLKNDISYIQNKKIDSDVFENIIKKCCTAINEYFDCYLGNKTCVCIKTIKTENILNEDIKTWEIRTLARSESTLQLRSDTDSHSSKVTENTDFELIISEGEDCFSTPNLPDTIEKFSKKGKTYKNSRSNFLDYYKSTIVVPIRIDTVKISSVLKDQVSEDYLEKRKYHVLGFLCVDSMFTFDNDIDTFVSATEQAKAFADIMYHLLETFLVSQITVEE